MVKPEGYFVVQSPGRTVLAGVRLLDADREKAIRELVPGIKTYTWSPNGTGEVMGVRHAGDVQWSQMPPRGMAYWESLNSVDVYFGPKAPQGKEANWVQTNPGKGWFSYFCFYGPTEPFFDKSWALPDFEKIN